jgi:DNA polymerase III alpha subunit
LPPALPSSRCPPWRSPTTAPSPARVELYRHADQQGIKPIIGCEVYVADDRRSQTKGYAHLTLLAQDNAGYANLIRVASAGCVPRK